MIKFLDLHYYFFDSKDPESIVEKHWTNFGFLMPLSKRMKVSSLFQSYKDKNFQFEEVDFTSVKGRPLGKYDIPFKLNRFVKTINPDFVLIHGLRYGLYAFFLRRILGNSPVIMVQVHGFAEAPSGIKKWAYRMFDSYIDGYLFTGIKNADTWINSGVFHNNKVFEVMEGATDFTFDFSIKKQEQSFLWVGRLDKNKDPVTILKAFEQYLYHEPNAKLTMVYNDFELLDEVNRIIESSEYLRKAVEKLGELNREEIEILYQNHQYFVLGSHYEGSGYALMEAMACGCVPVVTAIPSFNFMTNNGACAILFSPGNINELLSALHSTKNINYDRLQSKVLEQFNNKLSHEAIANDISKVFNYLSLKKQE